jgi:hypothetical protein
VLQNALTHWKTTLTGILGAAAYAALGAYQHGMTLKDWAMAAAIAVLGVLAADAQKAQVKTP